jgi:hypothetical protein
MILFDEVMLDETFHNFCPNMPSQMCHTLLFSHKLFPSITLTPAAAAARSSKNQSHHEKSSLAIKNLNTLAREEKRREPA